MKYLIILSVLFSSYGFTQNLTTLDKNKGKVKANPVNTADNAITKITKDLTNNSKQSKNSHMYAIMFKDSDGNHTQKPRFVYREKGESMESVKKRVKIQEQGNKYKISLSGLSEKYPEGLLYSKTKNGKTKYYLGYYTTKEYARKMWKEKENLGYTCIEYKSLN